jgi:hypothetical protein
VQRLLRFRVDHELASKAGALMDRRLSSRSRTRIESELQSDPADPADAVFGKSVRLTRCGAQRVGPTPGHPPGSGPPRLRGTQRDVQFIGDMAFDDETPAVGSVAGVDADISAARASCPAVRAWTSSRPTVVVATHDLIVPERLRNGILTH